MAAKKKISSQSSAPPLKIGNCEVVVEAERFTCESGPNALQISVTRNAKINISVKEELNRSCGSDALESKAEEKVEKERPSICRENYTFVLVNPKDADSSSKRCLQEALKIYTRELPTMNYAANTGKQSLFLERCVSNGKYCTLLLKSKSLESSVEVIATITYQIVPADMQFAEVPLAAVSSVYQRKGFGHFLYMELRKRLESVGVRTIFCWGDKESEGFWLKQGFAAIAEVDRKGKPRRLPIKANIRRALCFPGGSTLMVSHINEDVSANPTDSLAMAPGLTEKGCDSLNSSIKSSQPKELVGDGAYGKDNSEGVSHHQGCDKQAASEGDECQKIKISAGLANVETDADIKLCSLYKKGKRRRWEASLSSLKSKKVKGSHQIECDSDSSLDLATESSRMNKSFRGCSLDISKDSSFVKVVPLDPLISDRAANNSNEVIMPSEALVSNECQSKGGCFRIMLMDIAEGFKKQQLTKVIETLGGAVTPYGHASTHVVAGKVRSSLNFCTALSSGAWIVSSSWLKESFRKGRFVDESPYLLSDEDYVLKYKAQLRDAVLRAKARPQALLRGYTICIAAHVEPPVRILYAIVRSAGGNIIFRLDEANETSETIYIACEEDMEEALSAAKKGIRAFGSDWLMNCIMRQELDLDALQFAESL